MAKLAFPSRMRRGPGKLPGLFNALRDFVVRDRVIPGSGLVVNETMSGKIVSLTPSLVDLARQYEEKKSGSPGASDTPGLPGSGGSTPGNIFDGGGSGTGLPDTGTDEAGNPTDPAGNPLGWNPVNVCVSDGAGGWTPMVMRVYASLSAS